MWGFLFIFAVQLIQRLMKTVYVIQDIETNQYYYSWHTHVSFTRSINTATHYDTYDEALKSIKDDYNSELFEGKCLKIETIYKF